MGAFRSRYLFGALAALVAWSSCRWDDGPQVQTARVGFQPDMWVVDFGRHLEGSQAQLVLRLTGTGRAELAVEASTSVPFLTEPFAVLPAGWRGELTLTFVAGDTVEERDLVLTADGIPDPVVVKLRGEGVRPILCVPSQPCTTSAFDLETGTCIESVAPQDTPCVHPNPCMHNGKCDSIGQCIAEPRPCDDNNTCTNDLCSPLVGCVYTPRTCPTPLNPCHVATCHPTNGCGEQNAAFGTLCGAVDCVTANICDLGLCTSVTTPENFPCSPPVACMGPGACKSQVCVMPDAGQFPPTYRLPLQGDPFIASEGTGLVEHRGNLFAELCGPAYDAGCALVSWTSTAFERFSAPHGDPRQVLSASDAGVWMLGDDAVSLFDLDTGAPVTQVPLSCVPSVLTSRAWTASDRYATDDQGGLWLSLSSVFEPDAGDPDAGDPDAGNGDGGVLDGRVDAGPGPFESFARVLADGGVERFGTLPSATEHRLAFDRMGTLFAFDVDAGLSRLWRDDAGVVAVERLSPLSGAPAVIAGGGRVLYGNAHLFDPGTSTDLAALDWNVDAGALEMLYRHTLLTPSGGWAFFADRADGGTHALAFDVLDGGRLWRAEVIAPGQEGALIGAVGAPLTGMGALVQLTEPDGGPRAELQLYLAGERSFVCPLLPGSQVGAVVFRPGWMQALVHRDGGWALEAYSLSGAPLELYGWPAPNGASGTRRER